MRALACLTLDIGYYFYDLGPVIIWSNTLRLRILLLVNG